MDASRNAPRGGGVAFPAEEEMERERQRLEELLHEEEAVQGQIRELHEKLHAAANEKERMQRGFAQLEKLCTSVRLFHPYICVPCILYNGRVHLL